VAGHGEGQPQGTPVARSRATTTVDAGSPSQEASAKLEEAYDAQDIAWESLLLLGSKGVVAAAREWYQAVQVIEQFVRDQTHDPDRWSALLESHRLGRAKFYEAARPDLALLAP
jgi:hypothetical protein